MEHIVHGLHLQYHIVTISFQMCATVWPGPLQLLFRFLPIFFRHQISSSTVYIGQNQRGRPSYTSFSFARQKQMLPSRP